MAATHGVNSTPSVAPVLYVAFESSTGQCKLASCSVRGQRARIVSVPARDTAAVLREIARDKTRFGRPENAEVFPCYGGRTGRLLAPPLLASSRHQQCDCPTKETKESTRNVMAHWTTGWSRHA